VAVVHAGLLAHGLASWLEVDRAFESSSIYEGLRVEVVPFVHEGLLN
jgi:hypothetical protein